MTNLYKETLFLQRLLHLVIFLKSINDNFNFESEFRAIMIPLLINENNQILANNSTLFCPSLLISEAI